MQAPPRAPVAPGGRWQAATPAAPVAPGPEPARQARVATAATAEARAGSGWAERRARPSRTSPSPRTTPAMARVAAPAEMARTEALRATAARVGATPASR